LTTIVLKHNRSNKEFVLIARNLLLPNVANKKFGIGHIAALLLATVGGSRKLNSTELGKAIIQPIGKKYLYLMKERAKNILQMFVQFIISL
jgi:hypothetical protein